ncbi:MAG: FAD binding domain-containing protein [Candidatus Omnitrophica bacterium]|nr:FAD binding domain-containing protein [Candidatus Omnitrophota bacterium]
MLLNPFHLHQPKSLSEAAQALKDHKGAKLLAGGTFLINQLKQLKKKGLKTPKEIISLNGIKEMKGFEQNKDTLIIKSLTTIAELVDDKDLFFLRTASQNIATTPIRNMATLGGNLTCRYTWSEMPAVMIAYDAVLHFMGTSGFAEKISAEDFFNNNARTSNILTHISIKKNAVHQFSYQRVRKTLHLDVPILTVCIKAECDKKIFSNVRVVINSGTHFAQRDKILEEFLNGIGVSDTNLIKDALENLDNNIVTNMSNDYKIHMQRICIKNALIDIIQQANS